MSNHIDDILKLDFYDKEEVIGCLSSTTLTLDPTRVVLQERFPDEKGSDYLSPHKRFPSILGSLLHLALEVVSREEGATAEKIVSYMKNFLTVKAKERRLKVKFLNETITGKLDYVKDNKISDYKSTAVYSIIMSPHGKREWVEQLSINRWLWWKTYGEVLEDIGNVVAFIVGWRRAEWAKKVYGFRKVKYYPPSPILEFNIALMSFEETERFLADKIKQVKKLRNVPMEQLPTCMNTWKGKMCLDYCPVRDVCKVKQI